MAAESEANCGAPGPLTESEQSDPVAGSVRPRGEHPPRGVLLRLARHFAAGNDPASLLREVLGEAVVLVGGDDAAVARWDETRGMLVTLDSLVQPSFPGVDLPADASACGRAAATRAPVVVPDYQSEYGQGTPAGRAGAQAVLAVPLLFEGELLGTLSVTAYSSAQHFASDDAETLELLASIAAAALIGLQRARLSGALLAARTVEHELNNRLALIVGYTEMLAQDPALPPHLAVLAEEALQGAEASAALVSQLQGIQRLQESHWGPNIPPTLDLSRSLG